MQMRDIWVDDTFPDRLSQSKFWSNIAYAIGSVSTATMAYKGTLTADILLIYLAVVGLHTVSSKVIGLKFGNPALNNRIMPDEPGPTPPSP